MTAVFDLQEVVTKKIVIVLFTNLERTLLQNLGLENSFVKSVVLISTYYN